jgi:hypothetical protein
VFGTPSGVVHTDCVGMFAVELTWVYPWFK